MFDKAGNAIIIDFGCSGFVDIKAGTPKYYAPEQVSNQVLRHGMDARKLDSWSLGQTLAECLDSKSVSYLTD